MEIKEYWDLLINLGIATQEELELVTCISGYKIETLDDVLYVRTGYRNIQQFLKSEY